MTFLSFLIQYKWIILFYTAIVLLIYINRKKFEIQAKIIALYRTKWGIQSIYSFSKKHSEIIKILGYIGIGVGFIGLLFISGYFIKGIWDIFFTPDAPPVVTPVIPGVKIPGSPIFVPFWYGIIALFIVVLIHEFSHGIVAAAHGLKIKNTGFGMFAIFPIAFVEPDEKEVEKKSDVEKYSIFAAGPFSNILLGLFAFAIVAFALTPAIGAITNDVGVSFYDVQNNTPAQNAGLYPNMTIVQADSFGINNTEDFEGYLSGVRPNETITLYSGKGEVFNLTTTAHPDNPKRGYLGVLGVHTVTKTNKDTRFYTYSEKTLNVITSLFLWIFILSLGIGLANLLPIGPVDGGRMVQVAAQRVAKDKKRGDAIWRKISLVTIFILLLLVLVPILRDLLKF